ncbi:MAG: metal-sensitive transcriptional regulator [Alphaproteobacteria bacterium]|nr:metal-sensitive transcriptional regulator [Alphaproteobacteria bacterium]
MEDSHPSHDEELVKLNRISGQIDGIKRMIDEHRYCPDILTQLKAVRSAIRAVEANILETHLHSCIAESFGEHDKDAAHKKIDEMKVLFKRFNTE